jgi:hypothetical protein
MADSPITPSSRMTQESRTYGRRVGVVKYASAFDMCVCLLAGQTLELVDAQGRRWIASASKLECVHAESSETLTIIEGCAYDIAVWVARIARDASLPDHAFPQEDPTRRSANFVV